MRKLKTKFGTLYIEEPTDNRADEDRYVIEDSYRRWFDYFTTETVEETWGSYENFFNDFQNSLEKFDEPQDLLDYLGINYEVASTDWKDLLEYTGGDSIEDVLSNEYVNKIGNYYIFVVE